MTTIIIIDDSKSHRAALRSALEEAGEFDSILEAEDGVKGLMLLLTTDADAVVCDLEMPGFDGEKLLLAIRTKASSRDIPFIFATGSTDIERRVRLLEGGAQDVILKPFHPRELIARLRAHLLFRELQRDLSERNTALQEISTTDPLTKLKNRRYADEALELEFVRANRHKASFSILMIDLDFFKRINDEYGHPAGDAVLVEAAARILRVLRSSDVAARIGGEEFLIILANVGAEGAAIAAERWRSAISNNPFTLPNGDQIEITASLGAATFSPEYSSVAEFVESVDAALYRAKENGRNRVETSPGPGDEAMDIPVSN
jgi:diguanylate cyclase (GGDEF)-like protein